MTLEHTTDRSPADWLTLSTLPWHELAKFGPTTTFDAYARLRYEPDPGECPRPDIPERPNDEMSDSPIVADLCALLLPETSTPDDCYFCLWDGWPDVEQVISAHTTVHIPNRSYHLFTGPLVDVGQWTTTPTPYMPPPAFIWPADHAWCVAADVDQSWAGISASRQTVDRLTAQTQIDIVSADPREW